MFDEERHLRCLATAIDAFEKYEGSSLWGWTIICRVGDHGA
jgi:hypothetical protein